MSQINTLGDWLTVRLHIDSKIEELRDALEAEPDRDKANHTRGQIASLRALVIHFDPPPPPPEIKDTDTYG